MINTKLKSIFNKASSFFLLSVALWCYVLISIEEGWGQLTVYDVLPSIILIGGYFFSRILIHGRRVDWLSPDIIFLVLFYLFHFGYLYLFLGGLAEFDREVFFSPQNTLRAVYFCTLCIAGFLFGFNLIGFASGSYSLVMIFDKKLPELFLASKVLLVVVLLMFWMPILSIYDRAFSDYKVLISIGSESPLGKLYWVGQYLGVAALALFYICNSRFGGGIFKGLFSWLAIIYIFGYLIIGDRGGFLYFAIIPVIALNLFSSKIKAKTLIFVLVSVLAVSSVIAATRTSSIYNPFDALDAYAQKEGSFPVIDALVEFGSTFKTVPIAMQFVPASYDYWYGKSYLDSFMIVFPNFIGKRQSESVGSWLTETAFGPIDETHGRGGSIAMEAYINCGVSGSFMFFIGLGMVLAVVYKKFKISGSVLFGIFYLALMAAICLWMRNSSVVLFRTVLWAILFYYVAILFFSTGFGRYFLRVSISK